MATEDFINSSTSSYLEIEIPGVPVAKKRPRFSKFGTYDTQKDIKEIYRLSVLPQLPKNFKMFSTPISLSILFEMPIPKSLSKKKKRELDGKPHDKKPDIDNLYKMFDAYNGVLWEDDGLIYQVSMTKIYSENPQTTLIIRGLYDKNEILPG